MSQSRVNITLSNVAVEFSLHRTPGLVHIDFRSRETGASVSALLTTGDARKLGLALLGQQDKAKPRKKVVPCSPSSR